MEKENKYTSTSKHHAIYISIIVILILAMGVESYYFHKKSEGIAERPGAMRGQGMMRLPAKAGAMGGGMMAPVTPPALSIQQTEQLAATTTQKTFNITAGNFYFVPNKITVNKGDQVTFVMTNAGGVHDLIIDELGVKTPVVRTGAAATVTFTASKTGSFVYYCDIPGHKTKGMWGTLSVE